MKKMAIFVEGQTELLFTERLIIEIATSKNISISTHIFTGRRGNRAVRPIHPQRPTEATTHYILIFCSAGDEHVKSDIADRYDTLINAGHEVIIGLRDVYPMSHQEIPRLTQHLNYGMRTQPIRVDFILAILEIETWFIASREHLTRLNSNLTTKFIKDNAQLDLDAINEEDIAHPARILNCIYNTVGQQYTKSEQQIRTILDSIDWEELYINYKTRISALNNYVDLIDEFLSV